MSASVLQRGLPMITSAVAGNQHAAVAKWLLGCSGVVAGIVHVGGVTRLTKSGLSMTDWKPLGSLPPRSDSEWTVEFDRYKQYPEFQQRQSMTLDEFKYIYFWEWGHRMLGRFVGVCFAAPLTYFAVKNKIPKGYYPRMFTLLTMGGTQGLIGWWMVKSGLGEDRRGDRKEIRVSPYRLATHLTMAFSTYSLLLWTGLDLLHPSSRLKSIASSLSKDAIRKLRYIRSGSIGVTTLTAITAISGAFVAGNDAGNAYNTFPLMADQWIPWDDMIDESIQPLYRNIFENTATVQWDHRALAITTASSILGLSTMALSKNFSHLLTPQARRGIIVMTTAGIGQVCLGISTLLLYVPINIAAAHQLGSLALLSSGLYVVHSLRYVSPRVIQSISKSSAMKDVANIL
eukprot:CAMPEP_0116068484 /NCGR_PEP_ID=MMETSP0322-20121206/11686_1 /TAXON_ID=163516 /ORGANISM="Leptocylindrus danicus var. apora, Strain B651" /LENGTH=400 /DNA_ID=CAMNT_0003555599 /DNA_START=120 /DNA_END=1318 /DNA_ORIENTATION=-